ncbi:hypothetical protein A3749_16050 [Oleiphilus sp. HI0078]|nr:hypothetical protein A3749_16050 [Oleiphilus sp. HI0078]KZZ33133.1 hypothetical protein A3757_04180 [Oleiphilus sp. HI0117]KZZ35088.1 hypothetical protein A3756_02625 [Oleiphilus sp. HI0086]KZZ51870.1 hypothetical protein A3761_03405 [Oleiphilus sp. HI0123]
MFLINGLYLVGGHMRALENKHYLDNSCSIFRTRGWRSVAEVCALSFVFYLWMLSQSVLASEHDASKSYSSLWLSPIEGQEAEALTEQEQEDFSALQLRTHVSIQVVGPISRVSVKQEFYNPSDLWVEGEYSYPLPETAAVDQLRLHIGDRVVEGQVQEKKQAAKTFAKARKEGKKASLLSHRRSNRFRTQLTNIGPNESVTVEFEYQQWLDYKAGQYDLRFPMVSTPTYTSTVEEGSRASLQKGFVFPENHYRRLAEKAGNPLSIRLDIDAGIPINAPESNSHQVSINKLDSSRYQIELTGEAELSNRDFLLSWQPEAASQPTVTVMHEPSSDGHDEDQYGLLMVMPPQEKFAEDDSQDRNLVLVLDVSGSMQGASIQQAKAAMLKALDQLEEDDFFNLIWFNNRAMSLFPISQQASARNLSIARHKVNQLNANGGTNMLPALNIALQSSEESLSTLRQVVFITDGAVSNEAELFTMIRQELGHSRLFTVGIGSAPNSYFMRKAAHAGRGSFTYISQPESVEDRISELFTRLAAPALSDVSIDFQGYEVEMLPSPLPDVYAGEPLYAAFRAEHMPEYATLSGKIAGRDVYMRLSLQRQFLEADIADARQKGIAIEWARRKIEHLLTLYRESEPEHKALLQKEMTDLALEHRLVSKFTSLVAVDVTPQRSGVAVEHQKIPANLPDGWAQGKLAGLNRAQTLRLAQTSSGLWFQLYVGLVALLLVTVLLYLSEGMTKRKGKALC